MDDAQRVGFEDGIAGLEEEVRGLGNGERAALLEVRGRSLPSRLGLGLAEVDEGVGM